MRIFCLVCPCVCPQIIHNSEMSKVHHVGDLCQRLKDTPREEFVDDTSMTLDTCNYYPSHGKTPC